MRRWTWLAMLALMMVPMLSIASNEVQFGTTGAYWYAGDVIKIPVMITNDQPITAWGIAFRCETGIIYPDSITVTGRVTDPTALIIGAISDGACTNHLPADTGYLICALNPSRFTVPVGSGEVCGIWLHGYPLGSQISFTLLDSLHQDPEHCFQGLYTKFISATLDDIYPVLHSSNLTVMEAPMELTAPSTASGKTLKPVTIAVSATSQFGPPSLEIISFEGPTGSSPFPTITGNGPWDMTWIPGLHGAGAYLLTFRVYNDHGQSITKSVAISVTSSVLSGDIDCNGYVDLSDLTRMINWLIAGTMPPVCP